MIERGGKLDAAARDVGMLGLGLDRRRSAEISSDALRTGDAVGA